MALNCTVLSLFVFFFLLVDVFALYYVHNVNVFSTEMTSLGKIAVNKTDFYIKKLIEELEQMVTYIFGYFAGIVSVIYCKSLCKHANHRHQKQQE